MKIAVLGGSFNPVHLGHLALADDVCVELGYDKVIFVPACKPPHKRMASEVPPEARLEMTRIACEGDGRFLVDDCELVRGGVSYTYDTICLIEEKYRGVLEGRPALIMGSDLLPGFHLWHRAAEIAQKCTLVLARRPAAEASSGSPYSNSALGGYAALGGEEEFSPDSEPLFKNAIRLSNPVLPISSTDIRRRAGEGKSFRYLVPCGVFDYIMKSGIYSGGTHGN